VRRPAVHVELLDVFTNAVARPSTARRRSTTRVSTLFFQAVPWCADWREEGQLCVGELELDLEDLLGFETAARDVRAPERGRYHTRTLRAEP